MENGKKSKKKYTTKILNLRFSLRQKLPSKTNLNVILPQDQGPFDIIIESEVAVQVKHPSNKDKAFKRLFKFEKDLAKSDIQGIFAIGYKDAFNYGDRITFTDEGDFIKYYHTIASQVEKYGTGVIPKFENLEHIVGHIGITSLYALIGSDSSAGMNLRRFSNSMVIDNHVDEKKGASVLNVLKVFNPDLTHIRFE